jgi:hypothetical protein
MSSGSGAAIRGQRISVEWASDSRGRFLVALGLRKKRDDLNDSDIKKAERILAEHDQRVRERTRT